MALGVDDESKLLKSAAKLHQSEIKFVIFREPDKNNEATAIATEPVFSLDKRKLLRNFQLLKE